MAGKKWRRWSLDPQQERCRIVTLLEAWEFVAARVLRLDRAQFLAQRFQPLLHRRLHQTVGAISAIVRGQRQKAVAGQQQLGSGRHLYDPPRRMGGRLRIRTEQPVIAAVDAIAGGPQSAKKFRPAEAGSRR